VLLDEMVGGQRPFQGAGSAALAAAILTSEPAPLGRFAPSTPAELERIVMKLLRKQPDSRYQTAKDLLIDLRTLKEEQEFQLRLGRTPAPSAPAADRSSNQTVAIPADRPAPSSGESSQAAPRRSRRAVGLGLAALLVVVAGGWYAWQTARVRSARRQVTQVAALADAGRYAEAYDLALAVEPYVRGDPTLTRVMPAISDSISVTTEPSGATVYLQRFTGGTASPRVLLGTSPLTNVRVARGEYVVAIEKGRCAPIGARSRVTIRMTRS
jgi:hypothetical protein